MCISLWVIVMCRWRSEKKLTKAFRELEPPFFVHCHRGLHRAPAAAAIGMVGLGELDPGDATAFLKNSGTSEKYKGLYAAASNFEQIPIEELEGIAADFVEEAESSSFAKIMSQVDVHWSNLDIAREADFKTPEGHPDLNPAHEVDILIDLFKKTEDTETYIESGNKFKKLMTVTQELLLKLHGELAALNPENIDKRLGKVNKTYKTVKKSCRRCHHKFRD